MRTTVIYAPHPDDETLYLAGYVTYAANRGDRLILVAATDGGASSMKPSYWTVDDLTRVRRMEQEAAWRALTGQDYIIRIGSPDSADPDLAHKISVIASAMEATYGSDVEHYAACCDGRSQGVDHDAVALGLRSAGVRVARFSLIPGSTGGTVYKPPTSVKLADCVTADQAYRAFGHRSVGALFTKLRDSGYTSRIAY